MAGFRQRRQDALDADALAKDVVDAGIEEEYRRRHLQAQEELKELVELPERADVEELVATLVPAGLAGGLQYPSELGLYEG